MPYAAISDKRLVPFVFAVTGHRSVRDEDQNNLRAQLLAIFAEYHRAMPNTPFMLLTGLAEGADQLAAECALSSDVSVIAVLPMPLTIYRKTMSVQAAENLDRLIVRAAFVRQILSASRNDIEMAASEDVRADCYDNLGKYLALNCQVMIALWDGLPSEHKGGTANVVDYVLQDLGEDSDNSMLAANPQTGVVYHLLTPRPGQQTNRAAGSLEVLFNGSHAAGGKSRKVARRKHVGAPMFGRVRNSIERFNHIASKQRVSPHAYLGKDDSGIAVSPFLDRIDAVYGQSDAISRRAAAHRKRFFFAILAVIITGTLSYSIAAELYKDSLVLWLVLPLTITIALTVNWLARHARIDDLYVDSRALSETLRVQYFWQKACVLERAVDHYLPHHAWEVDWVRCALRTLMLFREDDESPICSSASLKLIRTLWIEYQCKWYAAKSKEQSRHVQRGNAISKWILFTGLACSILVPVTLLFLKHTENAYGNLYSYISKREGWLHFPGVLFTVFAGAYRLWTDQFGFNEQSREYDRISHYLTRQAKCFATHRENDLEVQKLLIATGIETLQENARWILLHRERPLEVVNN